MKLLEAGIHCGIGQPIQGSGKDLRHLVQLRLRPLHKTEKVGFGKPQIEKKVGDRYNVLRKGKVIFWNVSESELFDIMEDLAVECYYNKTLTSNDITYEPYIEEPLNGN